MDIVGRKREPGRAPRVTLRFARLPRLRRLMKRVLAARLN
jgi:hypothetical protein